MVLSQGILVWNIKALAACSKVISKVKVFKKWVKLQGQGDRVKNYGTHGKVLSQGIYLKYQSSSTDCSKVISKVKVSERRTE